MPAPLAVRRIILKTKILEIYTKVLDKLKI